MTPRLPKAAKAFITHGVAIASTAALCVVDVHEPDGAHPAPVAEVHFSPGVECREAIVREIDRAKESIRVQAYGFTSWPIGSALGRARKRGIDVQIVLDKSNLTDKHSLAETMEGDGIAVLFDRKHKIAHNKLVIIDQKIVITGSFNLTASAETNAENILILEDPRLASAYLANWTSHAGHSRAMGEDQPAPSQSQMGSPESLISPLGR